MGEAMLNKILNDAREEAETIRERAREKAEEAMLAARKEAKIIREKAAAHSMREAKEAKEKELSSARMASGLEVLSFQQGWINRVMQKAKKKIEALSDEEYEKLLLRMLKSCGIEGGEMIVSLEDKKRLKGKLPLAEKTEKTGGGFLLKKGEVIYNYTFDALFLSKEEELRQGVLRILRGGDHG